MPARPREPARPLDSQALALSIFASLSGAILSSALGAGELGSLVCAAIAPALTAIVTHPGPHRRRRLALVVALLALLHLIQSALARVRGRQVRARTVRAGSVRFAGLTAAIAFAISAVLLTTPELVLGDAFVSDRRLTLFPVDTPEPRPVPRPTPTPSTTATPDPTPTAAPRKPRPRPTATPVPNRDAPDRPAPEREVPGPRPLDPDGPPPDRTAPELDVPGAIAAHASDRRRAVVRYAVRAVDRIDGAVTPACRPPSGSRFPVGTTTVRCTARDRAGNIARGSFVVRVAAPEAVTPPPDPDAPKVPERPKEPESPKPPERPNEPENPKPPEDPGAPEVPGAPDEIPPPPDEPDRDRTPPEFTGPRLIIVDTRAREGEPVTYPPPPAVDDRDGPVRARCAPSTVPAGSRSEVQCTATDRARNRAQATFLVWARNS